MRLRANFVETVFLQRATQQGQLFFNFLGVLQLEEVLHRVKEVVHRVWGALSVLGERGLRQEAGFSLERWVDLCQHIRRVHKHDLLQIWGVLRPFKVLQRV